MPRARSAIALFVGATASLVPASVSAQTAPEPLRPPDQIVLSGDVSVRRGQQAGEVVVLHGTVNVAGVVRGDVIVIDGSIEVTGQVSGAVVNVNGPISLGPSSQVLGDVIAGGRVRIVPGAQVEGDVRQDASFTFRTPIGALGRLAPWLAIWSSVLALGLVLLLLGPRAADSAAVAAREAPWASIGWGVVAFVAMPVAAVIAVLTLVWLPLGLGLLLALFLVYSIGLAWSAFALGRLLWREPRGRTLAFAIGWAILAGAAAIPFVGGVVWVTASVFGLGASTVALWRAREGPRPGTARGRHRPGGKMAAPAAAAEPVVMERGIYEEGAGL